MKNFFLVNQIGEKEVHMLAPVMGSEPVLCGRGFSMAVFAPLGDGKPVCIACAKIAKERGLLNRGN